MTRERKIAARIWNDIAAYIDDFGASQSRFEVKKEFCENWGLKWHKDCWFCHNVRKGGAINSCARCPLGNCAKNSLTDRAIHSDNELIAYTACRKIAMILNGEMSYEFKKCETLLQFCYFDARLANRCLQFVRKQLPNGTFLYADCLKHSDGSTYITLFVDVNGKLHKFKFSKNVFNNECVKFDCYYAKTTYSNLPRYRRSFKIWG